MTTKPPWYQDPLYVTLIGLIVLFFVLFGPSMCDTLGVPRP